MLQAVMEYVNNWFERDVHVGRWRVEDGALTTNPGLLDGQYYRIVGSVFNDGLHLWPASDEEGAPAEAAPLTDEEFEGEVRALAVPRAVVELAGRIAAWVAKYSDVIETPFTSESFGGYSYSKGATASDRASVAGGWRSAFASDLNRWRKL